MVLQLQSQLPPSWFPVLGQEFSKPYMKKLEAFLADEYENQTVYPPQNEVFSAYSLTPFSGVNVLILGQDPYHGSGQAHGLSFSVKPGVRTPPSLRNMYKELAADVGCATPNNGCLKPWAEQGVMMLNTILTVREQSPASHQKRGWEQFTDATISALSGRAEPLVFVLWGNKAKKKSVRIDHDRHIVITGAHPSPLSAYRGFFGSRPFSTINRHLASWGRPPVTWAIPDQ